MFLLRKQLFNMLFKKSIIYFYFYIRSKIQKNGLFDDFYNILFLIPGINLLGLSIRSDSIFASDLASKKQDINIGKLKSSDKVYNKFFVLMLYIIPLVLSIPFLLIDIFHIIILILISIPFKFIPIKYYFGLFDIKKEIFY